MAVFLFTLLFYLVCTNFEANGQVPSSVDSRFFGLGGLGGFINNLFPGINLGNQGGPGRNPPGMDFPANSQFYPTAPIQGQTPPVSSGQGNAWPVLDDASQFPNHGNTDTQLPQGNGKVGGYTQYPPKHNIAGYPNYQMPPNQMYQYPNYGGGNSQYPNQGNFMNLQNPNQGNFGGRPQYPNVNNGGNQFPNDGGNWDQYPNNYSTGTGPGDGTLDSIVPPTNQSPWNTDTPNGGSPSDPLPEQPSFQNSNDGNAILGRPVVIPPSTTDAGQIIYPSSTQSPVKKQCVQDCQTTTEYNPVCGSDNITYINPGKFVCARNCGLNVFVSRRGRCPGDPPNPRNVLVTTRPMLLSQ